LEAYQRVHRLLVDELGADPGPELRRLHQAILASDPALAFPSLAVRPASWARASQLPVDMAAFVGRDDLINQIQYLLADDLSL
jgi:DNA-binding SARP family transcriptional activator